MRILSTSFLLVTVLLWSCNPVTEVEPGEETDAISNEEVAEVVGAGLAEEDQGLTTTVTTSTAMAIQAQGRPSTGGKTEICGVLTDTTLMFTNPAASRATYAYTFEYETMLNCANGFIPQSFDTEMTYTGSFNGPRYTSENSGEGDMSISNILPDEGNFVVNGTWDRGGSYTSKVREQRMITSTTDFTLSDVQVDKGSYEILSGSATVHIVGEVSTGEPFDLTATVTFLGNKQGEVTLGDETFLIDLESGEVTQG
ncbi:MAG: hypothetical protein AAFQ98_18870 [Bacteroidota bacterium]